MNGRTKLNSLGITATPSRKTLTEFLLSSAAIKQMGPFGFAFPMIHISEQSAPSAMPDVSSSLAPAKASPPAHTTHSPLRESGRSSTKTTSLRDMGTKLAAFICLVNLGIFDGAVRTRYVRCNEQIQYPLEAVLRCSLLPAKGKQSAGKLLAGMPALSENTPGSLLILNEKFGAGYGTRTHDVPLGKLSVDYQ